MLVCRSLYESEPRSVAEPSRRREPRHSFSSFSDAAPAPSDLPDNPVDLPPTTPDRSTDHATSHTFPPPPSIIYNTYIYVYVYILYIRVYIYRERERIISIRFSASRRVSKWRRRRNIVGCGRSYRPRGGLEKVIAIRRRSRDDDDNDDDDSPPWPFFFFFPLSCRYLTRAYVHINTYTRVYACTYVYTYT